MFPQRLEQRSARSSRSRPEVEASAHGGSEGPAAAEDDPQHDESAEEVAERAGARHHDESGRHRADLRGREERTRYERS